MKIYIAGKITGMDGDECEGNFLFAEGVLERLGHEPLNPLKLVDQSEGRTYSEYLLDALKVMLEQADALYMLPNWRDSLGARIEHAVAQELPNLVPIYYAASDLPKVRLSTSIKIPASVEA